MKAALATFATVLATVFATSSAQAFIVSDCEKAGVDLRSVVLPVAQNALNFYNNQVAVYKIDQLEPAAAAMGLAVVMPDPESEVGDSKCIAITGFGDVKILMTKKEYSPKTGLRLAIPKLMYDGNGKLNRAGSIVIKINLATSSISVSDTNPTMNDL